MSPRWPELRCNIRARGGPGCAARRSPHSGELLLERLDIPLVHDQRLAQARDAGTIFLGVRALLRQGRRSAIRVGDSRLREELLLRGEFVREHLAAHAVASLL